MSEATTTPAHHVRGIRLNVDTLINSAATMRMSRECSLAYTKLQESKMWLGKILQALAEKNPYPDSKNPENTKIEKQAEHTEKDLIAEWDTKNWGRTQCVKDLRSRISAESQLIFDWYRKLGDMGDVDYTASVYAKEAWLAAELSVMWFGNELNRILTVGEEPAKNEQPINASKI